MTIQWPEQWHREMEIDICGVLVFFMLVLHSCHSEFPTILRAVKSSPYSLSQLKLCVVVLSNWLVSEGPFEELTSVLRPE